MHKISRRHRLRFSQQDKELVCRSCSSLLVGGETRRVRLRNGMKIIHCLNCGAVRRLPYKQTGKVIGMSIPDSIMRQAKDASLPVTIRIGKSGLTDAVVIELSGQLSSRSLVKAKVNRGLFSREDLKQVWQHLADETSSQLIFVRGNVAVFWKN
jgi:RNA-binding protein YhbY